MKNKKILAVIMLFLVGICCMPTNSYAGLCDIKGHQLSAATCTSAPVCSQCGATVGSAKGHSYGSYSTSTAATCTSDGSKVRYCSRCGDDDWGTIAAKGHTGGSLSDNYNDSQHWKTCSRCGGGYDHASHRGGTWYPDGSSHYKDCDTCAKRKYTSGAHDKEIKKDIVDDDKVHDTYCSVCWNAGYQSKNGDEYQGTESHKPWTGGEEPTKHYCPACNHKIYDSNKYYHRYPGLSNGYITQPFYSCDVCSCSLSIQNGSYSELHITGLPADKYVASDASIRMDDIPEFPHATYDLYWTADGKKNPTLRNESNQKVSPKINPADVAIYSWGRKSLKTHAIKSADYAKDTYEKQMELNGYAVIGTEYVITSEEELFKITDMINSDINRASDHEKIDWNGVLHEMCPSVYRNGSSYQPTITQSGTSYELKFNHPTGGWLISPNMFLKMSHSYYLQDSLFQYGEVEKEAPVPWVANIYYCYRVKDTGAIPKNGYKTLYTYATVTVYNSKPIDVTVSIPADMKLIDKTGYRYVGVATQVSAIGSIKPATAPTSTSSVGTVTVGWDYNRAAAIVTFFVEPVLCSWNQYAVNYNGDTLKLTTASHEGSGLEFPDYYDKNAGKCYIPLSTAFDANVVEPLESLHKYYWPGYILRKSGVYPEGSSVDANPVAGSSVRTYNDEQTTKIDGSSPGYVINERIPSFYDAETDGYAVDKNFRFFYNTPTIDIEHKKYGTNEYMTSVDGRDIKYKQQIANQYAYVDSLITDNIKNENYVLSVSTATGNIETFEYKYPRYDLVQVKIYEITDGKQTHYGTLYIDQDYKDGSKSYLVEGYQGIFAKYYSESLKAIASQIGKAATAFNTNKNWKIEFIYDEVERVYIQFKDLKGNSIFIQDEAHPGRYIGELTAKVPRVDPFTYTPKDLGENGRFKLVQYTSRPNGYVNDHKEDLKDAMSISSGTTVSVYPNQGYDTYMIFYYLTGEMITVEYRDLNENTIKDPDTFEIPITGINLEVPEINLYEVEGYKHNPDYDPTTDPNNIPGETKTTTPTGEEVFVIDGTLRPLTVEDKEIGIPNPEEKSHHVIIYYESKQALKVEYRDMENNPIPVPPQYITEEWLTIPDTGLDVEVPTVPGYEVKVYQHNPNYNGTDTTIENPARPTNEGFNVRIDSNGNNQYIIIYYEKKPADSKLRVEFREDIPEQPEIKDPIEMDIPSDIETPIYVPAIPPYIPVDYEQNGTPDIPIPEDRPIEVKGDPENPIEIIIWYKKTEPTDPDPEIPTIITPDDNLESAYLKANKQYSEEYETEVAIPTSEDLYVSGDVYDYRMVTDIETVGEHHFIDVVIRQPYYTKIGSDEEASSLDYIELPIDDVELIYNYFKINKAELYDLKKVKVENGAIKFYDNYDITTDTAGHYIEGEANYKVVKNQPYFEYNLPEKVADANNDAVRIQINSTAAYTVEKSGGKFIITIKDVDYYDGTQIAAGAYKDEVMNQLRNEAEAIIEKCTQIKVPKLTVNLENEDGTGEHVLDILTGEKYYMPNKSEVLNSTDYYVPYVAGRAPLYSFYHNKDLYVREEAENKYYGSTVAGDYRLIEAIIDDTPVPADGKKLAVEKITVNPLNIHTPIINNVTLNPSDINAKSIQLEKTEYVTNGVQNTSATKVLNLEERFTIKIPNSGNHIDAKGYGNSKAYNHGGLTANVSSQPEKDANELLWGFSSRIEPKSADVLATEGILDNRKLEKDAIGPSFAEYKLVRFPYDVYLINTDETSPSAGKPQLFKANEWYNLYAYVKPSIDSYEFAIPIWVKDATGYVDGEGIHVLVVAENCPLDTLKNAMDNPMSVKTAKDNTLDKHTTYILRTSFNTYVSGRLYDLQIRDTDDPGYMNKLKAALRGSTTDDINELPIAQKGQVVAYNYGLKLGYRFYFDLKTKGISNKDITIKPNIYYVSANGTQVLDLSKNQISLFYHTKGMMYNKLTEKDLSVRMVMAGTHGIINNKGYTQETIAATQMTPARNFRNTVIIGKLVEGLKLTKDTQKLPYDNLLEVAKACGFNTVEEFWPTAKESASIPDEEVLGKNTIKDATGHWYGEYYLPATTYVYAGNVSREEIINGSAKSAELTTGYLVVVFEEIATEDDVNDENSAQPGYLTYAAPATPAEYLQQWQKEGIETSITLPNGNTNLQSPNGISTPNTVNAGAMAIYQVGLRANNDFEVEGTH